MVVAITFADAVAEGSAPHMFHFGLHVLALDWHGLSRAVVRSHPLGSIVRLGSLLGIPGPFAVRAGASTASGRPLIPG
jgi:hypothetical protein